MFCSTLQGYLAHQKPPQDPTVGLRLGPCSGPMGVVVSYERGTPANLNLSTRKCKQGITFAFNDGSDHSFTTAVWQFLMSEVPMCRLFLMSKVPLY